MPRLPNPGSRWVWLIDTSEARSVIEVKTVEFNGTNWWVTSFNIGAPYHQFDQSLEVFWSCVTPVGGRKEDLSSEISEEQHTRTQIA